MIIPKSIRKKVLERDNYSCRRCGKKDKLHIHHKNRIPRNKLKFLITLCPSCHKKTQIKEDMKTLRQLVALFLIAKGKLDFDREYYELRKRIKTSMNPIKPSVLQYL